MTDTPTKRLARVLRLLADVAERGRMSYAAQLALEYASNHADERRNDTEAGIENQLILAESYATEAARLAGVPRDGWVLVSDRLPEDDTSVLLTAPGGYVTVGQFGDNHWWLNGAVWSQDWALAWRPLPEPYRPEERTS